MVRSRIFIRFAATLHFHPTINQGPLCAGFCISFDKVKFLSELPVGNRSIQQTGSASFKVSFTQNYALISFFFKMKNFPIHFLGTLSHDSKNPAEDLPKRPAVRQKLEKFNFCRIFELEI
jgi:hypothetical protein